MMRGMNRIFIPVALGLLASGASAQRISAQSIIVNPQPDLQVSVNVNKDVTGTQTPTYRPGEELSIRTVVNRDAYVYLFNVDASGDVTQIFPNRLSSANFVKANAPVTFPASDAKFRFTLDNEVGLNKVLALASETPLNLDEISRFKSSQDQFATVSSVGQEKLAQALSIIVSPTPASSWATDTVSFNVAREELSQYGNLFVGTNVEEATVTVNGQLLGRTGTTYALRPGSYPVRIKAPGQQDFTTTLNIRAGQTTNLNVDFRLPVSTPAPQPSTTPVLDLLRSLIGINSGVTMTDPAKSAYDQKSTELLRDGYTQTSMRATTTGYVGTFQKGASTVSLTVTRTENRTLKVETTETVNYRY